MNCTQAEEALQAKLDGELNVNDAVKLGIHLAGCSHCQQLSSSFEKMSALVLAIPIFPLNERVSTRILPTPAPSVRRWTPWLVGSVAAAAVLILTTYVMQDIPSSVMVKPVEPVATLPLPPEITVVVKAAVQEPKELTAEQKAELVYFDPKELEKELAKQMFLAERKRRLTTPKAELEQEVRVAQWIRELTRKETSANAARKLAGVTGKQANQALWIVASATSDPQLGVIIFNEIVKLPTELKFAPIYIAALENSKIKQEALTRLRTISGKKLGADQEQWLAWLAETKTPGKS
jgi:hypothetical protein